MNADKCKALFTSYSFNVLSIELYSLFNLRLSFSCTSLYNNQLINDYMLDKKFTKVHPLFSARQTVIKIEFIYSVQGNCKIINLQIEKMKCLACALTSSV